MNERDKRAMSQSLEANQASTELTACRREQSKQSVQERSKQPSRSQDEAIAQQVALMKQSKRWHPGPLALPVVERFRELLHSKDPCAREIIEEIRWLRMDPTQAHSEAFAKFTLDLGAIISTPEQNGMMSLAGRNLGDEPFRKRRRYILNRIFYHAQAAGVFGGPSLTGLQP